jgi:hypothetical protein
VPCQSADRHLEVERGQIETQSGGLKKQHRGLCDHDKDGKPTHNEWVGKFDGKDYPVTGDPTSDMRSYKTVDANTLELVVKKAGTVTASGRIVVAADGKSRTVTTSNTDSAGKKVENMSWYDKQ